MPHGKYITALNNYLQGRSELHLLNWKETSEGVSNALTWTVVCKVGGEVRGSGTAGQLRVAKEEAARSACEALGITA